MKTSKKIFYSIGIVLIAALTTVIFLWRGEIRTIASIHKVEGNKYLYQLEYQAPYDLDEVLAANFQGNRDLIGYVIHRISHGIIDPIVEEPIDTNLVYVEHCTSYQAQAAEGGWYFGRNYDFFKNPSLVTKSRPKNGYASIAICDMSHFGYGLDKLPTTLLKKVMCLAAIYAPMDGINEKGLCTSIMALPKQAACQNTGKPTCTTSILMRLWLDRCATVDEALALLETVDMRHDQEVGSGYHYMVADAAGNSAVVEFDPENDWETMVIRKGEGVYAQEHGDSTVYQHVTNHLLGGGYDKGQNILYGNPFSKSWWRYDTLGKYLEDRNGVLTLGEANEALSIVHWEDLVWPNGMIENTQYSCVYDQTRLELHLREWNEYDKVVKIEL